MSKSDRFCMKFGVGLLAELKTGPFLHLSWRSGLLAAIGLGFASAACSQSEAQAADAAASAVTTTVPSPESARPLAPPPAPNPTRLRPAPNWQALDAAQRQILAPLEQDWNGLDAARRSQWLEVAARFSSLAPEDQARMQERMRDWALLSPAQRQEARIGFQVAKKLDADTRQAKWEAYQALPPEQRQQLADKAALKQEQQRQKLAPAAASKVATATPQVKSNLVPGLSQKVAPKPVATSLLQAKPGATTVLITTGRVAPPHQQAGDTKILAHPELVDSKTLLPKKRSADTSPTS